MRCLQPEGDEGRALLTRRLDGGARACSEFYCVAKDPDKNFKKISSSGCKRRMGGAGSGPAPEKSLATHIGFLQSVAVLLYPTLHTVIQENRPLCLKD